MVRFGLLSAAVVVAGGVLASSASAAIVVTPYTSLTSFNSAIKSGSYTDTFSSLTPVIESFYGQDYTGGGYNYTISTNAVSLYCGYADPVNYTNPYMSYAEAATTPVLTITFTSNNVTAVGGNIFNTDQSGYLATSKSVFVSINGGAATELKNQNFNSFFGVTSSAKITSMAIWSSDSSYYAGLDNLVIGQASAVPEPGTLSVLGLAATGVLALRKKKA